MVLALRFFLHPEQERNYNLEVSEGSKNKRFQPEKRLFYE